jgi:mannose-6-phosphate isomerase
MSTPLFFQPLYMPRIWGGQNLRTLCRRDIPADRPVGESWELVDRPEAQSVTAPGGISLHDLWTGPDKTNLFGTRAPDSPRFPILVKLLDATDKLSLQVHPPADRAARLGGEPKTEMWYFLHTEPGAEIYVGLRSGVTRADFEKALQEGTVAGCFHRLKTAPGETMFLPSGRVHAIGAGNLILEIQQNSDTTYRVYDWNRVDAQTGQPRNLHVRESLESIRFDDFEPVFTQPHGERVLRTDYFEVDRIPFYDRETRDLSFDGSTFRMVYVTRGSFRFMDREWNLGDAVFFPANHDPVEWEAVSDYAELVGVGFPEK